MKDAGILLAIFITMQTPLSRCMPKLDKDLEGIREKEL
jgi:hypothetical protein